MVAADQILDRLGTADHSLSLMISEVPLDTTELVKDPNVVIPVLRISKLMGRFSILDWTHELDYLMTSGETSRKVFLHPATPPIARIMSRDISVNPNDPDYEERRSPSTHRVATPHEEEIIAHDLTHIANS